MRAVQYHDPRDLRRGPGGREHASRESPEIKPTPPRPAATAQRASAVVEVEAIYVDAYSHWIEAPAARLQAGLSGSWVIERMFPYTWDGTILLGVSPRVLTPVFDGSGTWERRGTHRARQRYARLENTQLDNHRSIGFARRGR
jgi:hypothetical protein